MNPGWVTATLALLMAGISLWSAIDQRRSRRAVSDFGIKKTLDAQNSSIEELKERASREAGRLQEGIGRNDVRLAVLETRIGQNEHQIDQMVRELNSLRHMRTIT